MNNFDECLINALFAEQPVGSRLCIDQFRTAVQAAQAELDRKLYLSDLRELGSKLLAPLLLLASLEANNRFKWSREHRFVVASRLLERLQEEVWGAGHV